MDFEIYPFEKLNLLLEDIHPNERYAPLSLTIGEPQFKTPQFILDALEITAKTSGNKVIENAIMKARTSIAQGESIAAPLSKEKGLFPPMVIQMITIGEQTGGLEIMLSKVADFYDAEVDQAVENLMNALEPIVIVFLGLVVGGMVMAMYLPIFKLASAFIGGG